MTLLCSSSSSTVVVVAQWRQYLRVCERNANLVFTKAPSLKIQSSPSYDILSLSFSVLYVVEDQRKRDRDPFLHLTLKPLSSYFFPFSGFQFKAPSPLFKEPFAPRWYSATKACGMHGTSTLLYHTECPYKKYSITYVAVRIRTKYGGG